MADSSTPQRFRAVIFSRNMALLALVSLANALVAVYSLEGLNVPMYNALKRLASLATLATEFLLLGKVYLALFDSFHLSPSRLSSTCPHPSIYAPYPEPQTPNPKPLNQVSSPEVMASIALVTLGALLAANYDMEFDLYRWDGSPHAEP
jgi:hypothetical protein